jgi:hypothetical protein
MANILTSKGRAKLAARRDPYWHTTEKGRAIAFRKMPDSGVETWLARARDNRHRYIYKKLGKRPDFSGTGGAKEAAEAWFAELEVGVNNKGPFTVADACREYIKELRGAKRDKTADDTAWRFKRGAILDHDPDDYPALAKLRLGAVELKHLRPPDLKQWRDLLDMESAGQNRMMTSLRSALNLAVANDRVTPTAAHSWRKVKQHKKAGKPRENFFTLEQRRALHDACKGAVRDLVEAALLIGARPGELRDANRSAFDAKRQTLKLSGKTGSRTVDLSPAAVALFTRTAKAKLPAAPLLARDDGSRWTKKDWADAIREAAAAAVVKDAHGKPLKDDHGKPVKMPPKVCLTDCRHTWISQAILDGLSLLDVSRLTGTSLKMIDENYGKLARGAALRERLALVSIL